MFCFGMVCDDIFCNDDMFVCGLKLFSQLYLSSAILNDIIEGGWGRGTLN